MFEEFAGIPLHPLVVHAAVVFLPLQALFALGYAALPKVRRQIWWIVAALAVIAPVVAYVARESGFALRQRKLDQAREGGFQLDLTKIDQHATYARTTFYCSIALGVLMLGLLALLWWRAGQFGTAPTGTLPAVLAIVVSVAVVGLAGTTGYYVYKTGDAGAHMTWEGQ